MHRSPVKSMHRSPIKRNLFSNISTPVKQNLDYQKSLSLIENECSPMKEIDNTYMQETVNKFHGLNDISSATGTSKQTYVFEDPKSSGKFFNCLHRYTHLYTHIYTHVHAQPYICTRITTHAPIHLHMYTHIYTYTQLFNINNIK